MKALCGIYEIRNTINDHVYIGSSVNLDKRWRGHRMALEHNNHRNRYLQRAWRKYGAASFVFRILHFCEPCDLVRCEQAIIDDQDPELLYNLCKQCVSSRLGTKVSLATRKRIGMASRGHRPSQETRTKVSEILRGKPWSEARRAACTPEYRARLSVAGRRKKPWPHGAHRSPENRARISASLAKYYSDPEARARSSAAHRGQLAWNKGLKMSPEICARFSLAHVGKPWSIAHRMAWSSRPRVAWNKGLKKAACLR